MPQARILAFAAAIAAFALWTTGCAKPAPPPDNAKAGAQDDHGHEHHHHGPHDGHMMVIGEEEYHAEWTHDDSGKVTFYILDSEAKKDVPIEADAITIDVKIGDNPPKKYELVAVNPKDGKTSAFSIVDKEFESLLDQLKSSG